MSDVKPIVEEKVMVKDGKFDIDVKLGVGDADVSAVLIESEGEVSKVVVVEAEVEKVVNFVLVTLIRAVCCFIFDDIVENVVG